MLGGLGAPEMAVILIVVLVIFGPKNLPKLGSAIGKTVRSVREGMDGTDVPSEQRPAETAGDEEDPDAS